MSTETLNMGDYTEPAMEGGRHRRRGGGELMMKIKQHKKLLLGITILIILVVIASAVKKNVAKAPCAHPRIAKIIHNIDAKFPLCGPTQ